MGFATKKRRNPTAQRRAEEVDLEREMLRRLEGEYGPALSAVDTEAHLARVIREAREEMRRGIA